MPNYKLIFILLLFVIAFTISITFAFFHADLGTIIRNAAIACIVFVMTYFLWTKINKYYEKFFRMGLGR